MNRQQHQLMRVVQKIPVFTGFTAEEAAKLLQLCHSHGYESGQTVYAAGEASAEMLIVMTGQLSVHSHAGEHLAKIRPGECTGEMGIFTGHPRSANIVAEEDSTGFVIGKRELVSLLAANKDMFIKLM